MYKMTVIGNLTKDPVIAAREFPDKETAEIVKTNVCNFTVGANEGRGAYKHTMYFRMNAWHGLADVCGKYLKKGSKVYIEGVPSINNFVDANNNLRSSIEVRVDRLEMLQSGKRIVATEDSIEEDTEEDEEMPY